MMYIFAFALLLLAFCATLCGAAGCLLALWQNRRVPFLSPWIIWSSSICLLLGGAMLLHALFWRDFSLEYVAANTDAGLSAFYRLTTFWAGQQGSLLFWAICSALAGSIFAFSRANSSLSERARLFFWLFYYALLAFFCLLLTGFSNPFMQLSPAPADGRGLNPLLQNPGMIFHPPLMFMGYAGFSVPACLSLACCAAGTGERWWRLSKPFIIISWSLLAAGILLGAWWAYMELGWGGYWGWDPVENASLLPWLAACALIHAVAAAGDGQKFTRLCPFLAVLTLGCAFFATWLVRGGAVESVHAFGGGGVEAPLLCMVSCLLVLALMAAVLGRRGAPLASPLSREGLLLIAVWIFLALAAIIGCATLWPLISRIWSRGAIGLGPDFYNRVCLPVATFLVLLLFPCLLRRHRAGFWLACGAAAISLAILWACGYRHGLGLVAAACAIGASAGLTVALFLRRRPLAPLATHLGLAILGIGVAFSASWKVEAELALSQGMSGTIGPYEIRLASLAEGAGSGFEYLRASLQIWRNGKMLGSIGPERRVYDKFPGMQFSEADVRPALLDELYAALLGLDAQGRAIIQIAIEPLVNWIWAGGALLCLLPAACLFAGRMRMGRRA